MDKEKINSLRAAAQARFDGATDPEDVKAATKELSDLDELEKEIDELEKNNVSLLASFKQSLKDESIKKDSNQEDDDEEEDDRRGLSFDDALKRVLAQRKKE